ncbi:gap junction alpha-3 protein [Platysternon megacephalum]|uniref:Gap junction alpha-3 protein n=1 Tax=Platysternon megacephalum TaxID=55544 RepID=A0A4D9ETA9_9SAUR|nr:gap junction alpha-3 protein [Platysternon megacephalum]
MLIQSKLDSDESPQPIPSSAQFSVIRAITVMEEHQVFDDDGQEHDDGQDDSANHPKPKRQPSCWLQRARRGRMIPPAQHQTTPAPSNSLLCQLLLRDPRWEYPERDTQGQSCCQLRVCVCLRTYNLEHPQEWVHPHLVHCIGGFPASG